MKAFSSFPSSGVCPLLSPPSGRGERGGGKIIRNRNLIQKAKELRRNMTEAERLLWHHLRAKQMAGFKFRRQEVIGNYIVDFACLKKKLIIEIDGGQHAENVEYDHKRTRYLERLGFKIIRFWNNEVLRNIGGVLQVILEQLSPPPTPSQREGKKNSLD